MLLSINNPDVLHHLMSKQAIRAEQIYTQKGLPCDMNEWREDEPLFLLENSLSHSTSLFVRAAGTFEQLSQCHKALKFAFASLNELQFVGVINEISRKIIHIAETDFDLAYAYLAWGLYEDYPVLHHLISALTLARVGSESKQFSNHNLQSLVNAALTMNIAMLDLQYTLQKQTSELTREQKELIRKHPQQGQSTLKLLGVEDQVWLDAVALHHENPDGTGYPRQIKNVSEGAILLAICDSFNARMAQRGYKKNFAPEDAVRDLFENGDPFTVNLASLLLQEVGIYPAGSILLLEKDVVACCLMRGKTPTMPLALVFRQINGQPVDAKLVDTSDRRFTIIRSISRSTLDQQRDLLSLLGEAA